MVQNALDRFKKSHPYISDNIEVEVFTSPFHYVVIKNLLRDDIYNRLCGDFDEIIKRAPPVYKTENGKTYNALIAGLSKEDLKNGYDFFGSQQWMDFVSDLFCITFNKYISASLHYHEAPSKSGWPHTDLNICAFNDDPEMRIQVGTNGANYADDTAGRQPHAVKCLRWVAGLYYYNNKQTITEADGGGTGLYDATGQTVIKSSLPQNNSLILFEISPVSYHSFIGANFNRSALVHWFHTSAGEYIKDNYHKIDVNNLRFERWSSEEAYNFRTEPDCQKYFN